MIPIYPYPQFPPQNERILDGGGKMLQPFYYLLRALFLRGGGNSGIPLTVGNALKASGVSLATALQLTNDLNEILSGSGHGVSLYPLQPGQWQLAYNGSGGSVSVYPDAGGQIDALGTSTAYSLANTKSQIFWCASTLSSGAHQYRSLQLG